MQGANDPLRIAAPLFNSNTSRTSIAISRCDLPLQALRLFRGKMGPNPSHKALLVVPLAGMVSVIDCVSSEQSTSA